MAAPVRHGEGGGGGRPDPVAESEPRIMLAPNRTEPANVGRRWPRPIRPAGAVSPGRLVVLHAVVDTTNESELVARIRAGDEAAFRALYLAHHDGLWRFAYTYVRSRDVAGEGIPSPLIGAERYGGT